MTDAGCVDLMIEMKEVATYYLPAELPVSQNDEIRSRKLSNYSQAMSHYETMSERICTEIKRIICSSVAGVGIFSSWKRPCYVYGNSLKWRPNQILSKFIVIISFVSKIAFTNAIIEIPQHFSDSLFGCLLNTLTVEVNSFPQM
ncbi:hypothetical protein HUJ05_009721 [Dendroctonus ponderosae]|nr:hypothetical protein HUJ05_009721 [Dendroctonus ponderosae]